MPSFAVVGAGAIGGYLGALLSAAGDPVTFIARGPNLEALRARGMTVALEDGREVTARVRASASPKDAGAHDIVLLTVKAHQVTALAPELRWLFHDQTTLVTMQNGIPWWYFQRHGGPLDGTPVHAADPDGAIARLIDPARIVGSVVYPAATLVGPGVVRVIEGRRFTLGELDGSTTARIQTIAERLGRAGFKAPITSDIRAEIWLKMLGNMSLNPLSALTHATLVDLLQFPPTRELCATMMREGEAVATALGVTLPVSIARRMAGAERVGAHKTSMLQDVEHGKPPEIEALVGAVVELGRITGVPTPQITAVYACVSLLARTLAEHGARVVLEPSAAAHPGAQAAGAA